MSSRSTLRQLVTRKNGLVVPGAYDGVSARLVERTGFPAVYMTGYGTSASRLGLPDLGYAGLAEMADHARNLAAAVTIPLIADADTGYGNALGVRRTVQMYEAAGVTPDREVITYCQGGYRAAHSYLALRLLGYPRVRSYVGSWKEWGDRTDLPLEVPAKR